MRCKTCDYPLWNLPARKCPECGADFKPSDFQFVPNSVRFACPHCLQSYYGTTGDGHLIPRSFDCVQCGKRIDMDEMVLQPAAGVQEAQTQADVMPWLERRQRGLLKALVGTTGLAMVGPQRLMRAVPLESGAGQAWLFGLVINTIITLAGAVIPLLIVAVVMLASGNNDAEEALIGAAVCLVAGTAGMLLFIVAWGAITHGLMKVTGGTRGGIGRTYQALLYSSATNAPMAVPCIGPYCGGYLTWVWWLVSAILMVMEGQKVRGLRATLCVATPPLLLVGGVILGYAALIYFAFASAATRATWTAPGGGYVARAEATTLSPALLNYAAAHNGQCPAHALELVADGSLPASAFAIWQIGHDEANVPVAGTTLSDVQFLPPNRMRMAAESAAAALPRSVIAHRLGDVVITGHGIDVRSAPVGLWLAIICPDPDQQQQAALGGAPGNPNAGGASQMVAVAVDGSVVVLGADHVQAVSEQNRLRAAAGLAPLPDPLTITHARPATSGP